MPRSVRLLFLLITVELLGCGVVPEKVSLTDPRLVPMLRAIAVVDREVLGFTPISPNSDVRLESRPRDGYDAMLHIYANTRRTIAFRKDKDGYRWIGEQEIHKGPKTYNTPDGPSQRRDCDFIRTGASGGDWSAVTAGHVRYHGEDTRLAHRDNLTRRGKADFGRVETEALRPGSST